MAKYLTLEEAAQKLGVEYKTLYRVVRSGDLPAGKVGRIYRIRDDDLEAYFERQKELVADQTKRTGLTAIEGIVCGACGNQILSELSIGGRCEFSNKPICQACWSIKKIRTCTEDAEPSAEGARAAAEEASKTGDAVGSTVEEQEKESVEQLRQQGKPVITAEDAKLSEQAFLRTFGQRLEEIEELPEPLSNIKIRLRKARVKHQIEETCRVNRKLPANRISRFTLRVGGWSKPKTCLTLEGRFLSRPGTIAEQGYDAEPIGDTELRALLNDVAEKAKQSGCFGVVLIGSPTGWTTNAAEMVTGIHGGKSFRDRRVAVVLEDLHTDEVFMDKSDKRLWAYWQLIAPAAYTAKVAACVEQVGEILSRKNSVSAKDAGRICKADESWVRAAFLELEQTGEFSMDELPDMGLVISRIST